MKRKFKNRPKNKSKGHLAVRNSRKHSVSEIACKESEIISNGLTAEQTKGGLDDTYAISIKTASNVAQIKLDDAVEAILDQVDEGFPAALSQINRTELHDDMWGVAEWFRTDEHRRYESQLLDIIHDSDDRIELEIVVYEQKYSLENFYQALGYAAGLRAGGVPWAAARTMMRGLLRNFDRANGKV